MSKKTAKRTSAPEKDIAEDTEVPTKPAAEEALVPVVVAGAKRQAARLNDLFGRFEEQLTGSYKATYGIAVTRIVLAITGIGLLLTNFRARHYVFGVGGAWRGELAEPVSDFPQIWLFSLFHRLLPHPGLFTTAYILLGIIAVLVLLGWRTRIVLPIYLVLWVSFIETNDAVGDQGDNAYRMFLLAMLFTNSSMRWSLDARRREKRGNKPSWLEKRAPWVLITAHNLALVVLAFQVCAIYVSGGLYKAGGDAWKYGFAIYNPLQTAHFGTWPVLSDLLTAWGPLVVALTWGSLLFQIAFPFLLFNRATRIIALLGILSFHCAIGLLMGLPWFSLTMIAVDAIFIRDRSYRRLERMVHLARRSWR
ncbi:HTTM domain-containing protein [Nesterenkonia sp.]|uniref:HTTM domain-containing protein n=1 Tax=Nesterenkonia sp. TaxID=704201 RepID=UPI00260ACE6C|nr:HTTM domain-containing protein [Nesterenkonia sp.]